VGEVIREKSMDARHEINLIIGELNLCSLRVSQQHISKAKLCSNHDYSRSLRLSCEKSVPFSGQGAQTLQKAPPDWPARNRAISKSPGNGPVLNESLHKSLSIFPPSLARINKARSIWPSVASQRVSECPTEGRIGGGCSCTDQGGCRKNLSSSFFNRALSVAMM
jgi:hypothetical protein